MPPTPLSRKKNAVIRPTDISSGTHQLGCMAVCEVLRPLRFGQPFATRTRVCGCMVQTSLHPHGSLLPVTCSSALSSWQGIVTPTTMQSQRVFLTESQKRWILSQVPKFQAAYPTRFWVVLAQWLSARWGLTITATTLRNNILSYQVGITKTPLPFILCFGSLILW